MDSKQIDKKSVLMAIHPKYAEAILNGTKKVEFRKKLFSKNVDIIFIYATSPIKAIIGFFRVKEIDKGTPEYLWNKYKEFAGLNEDTFKNYYKALNYGVAIEVGEYVKFKNNFTLFEVPELNTPPQSYYYLHHLSKDYIIDSMQLIAI